MNVGFGKCEVANYRYANAYYVYYAYNTYYSNTYYRYSAYGVCYGGRHANGRTVSAAWMSITRCLRST
jgi:hypothetical protein